MLTVLCRFCDPLKRVLVSGGWGHSRCGCARRRHNKQIITGGSFFSRGFLSRIIESIGIAYKYLYKESLYNAIPAVSSSKLRNSNFAKAVSAVILRRSCFGFFPLIDKMRLHQHPGFWLLLAVTRDAWLNYWLNIVVKRRSRFTGKTAYVRTAISPFLFVFLVRTAMSKIVFGAFILSWIERKLTNSIAVGNVPYNMEEVRVPQINSIMFR
jgi:hypothetical protein